jgi:hypothetical protein
VSNTRPWLTISATNAYVVSGMTMDKIGRRTGWTYGLITATCADVNMNGDRTTCTGRGQLYGGTGDSGGPVFAWDGEDGAILYGITTALDAGGEYGDEFDGTVYFSRYPAIENDLGSLSVITNITVTAPTISGSVSSGHPSLSWGAASVGNSAATTSYSIMRIEPYEVCDIDNNCNWYQNQTAVYSATSAPSSFVDSPIGTTGVDSGCSPSSKSYQLRAYNSGVSSYSNSVCFF